MFIRKLRVHRKRAKNERATSSFTLSHGRHILYFNETYPHIFDVMIQNDDYDGILRKGEKEDIDQYVRITSKYHHIFDYQ